LSIAQNGLRQRMNTASALIQLLPFTRLFWIIGKAPQLKERIL
jgi:hypothetical protein